MPFRFRFSGKKIVLYEQRKVELFKIKIVVRFYFSQKLCKKKKCMYSGDLEEKKKPHKLVIN